MINNMNIQPINIIIEIFKMFFMSIFTYNTSLKIMNNRIKDITRFLFLGIFIAILCFISLFIRYKVDYTISVVALNFLISFLYSKDTKSNIGFSIMVTFISASINYIIWFIGICILFIFNIFISIQNDYINFILLLIIQIIILYAFGKIKRIKNGLSFLKQNSMSDYFDIIILIISIIILFSSIIFAGMDIKSTSSKRLGISFIMFVIVMFITIQKSIQLYYKQKLMIKDLNETKSDLEKAKQEIELLEKENIELSKKNHSFKHQYKSLKYKVDEITAGNKSEENAELCKDLENLSKDIYVAPKNTELVKTGITEIDDMLNFMKFECDENNISLTLQILGNIYYMINNLIPKEELEILLADHIKDAIIAIKHSDNVNKSILVKLGKVEDCYGVYIYDSGIEFKKETLANLGVKPVTTHKDEGGSGMGFMNTFDTLRNHKASLIIEELGKPCKDNFTKIIKIIFDGKCDFKVISYKNNK